MITLDDIIDHLEGAHRYSGYAMCLCPFHDDKNPSCRVWDTSYKCLSCGAHGSIEKLYEQVSGRVVIQKKSYNPAARIWDRWLTQFGSVQAIAKLAYSNLKNNPDLANYLIERKIDSQIKNCMLGYLDGYYTFPVRDEYDEIQGLIARASPTIQTKDNRYTVSPNCPIKLYVPSQRAIRKVEEIYVVYGILDSISMTMAGYPTVTGISGQALNSENLTKRVRHFVIPDRGEERSGLQLQYEMGWRATMLMLDWPSGNKDLNDIHRNFGLDKIKELVKGAMSG